jgi:hypothetical protein
MKTVNMKVKQTRSFKCYIFIRHTRVCSFAYLMVVYQLRSTCLYLRDKEIHQTGLRHCVVL